MERVGLDHHTLEIQLAKQRFKHSPFMVLSRGVVGLADGYRQCRRVEGDMRNERRTTAGGGLDRTAHGFAVADKLIQFLCSTRDLGERPITDGRTEHRNVYLMEEVSEGRIRWRAPQLDSQCAGESDVVADGEPLEIKKALAAAKDAENSDQEEVPGRDARIPRRLRMSGMARKKLIRSRSVAAAGDSDKGTQQSRQGHRKRSTLA